MGFWLRDHIKTWTNVTDSDTQRLPLPNSGIISAVQVRVNTVREETARDAGGVCRHICQDMDKIEVIETGQKVLKSLDGTMCLANNLMDFKVPAHCEYTEEAGGSCHDNYFLLFGRYIMDREYGLDLARHKDVRLEIHHTFDATDKTGFQTGQADIEIYIWRWIGADLPVAGWVKTSEKYHYTHGASAGEVRMELPCLNPYRRILIRTYKVTKTVGECLTDVELVGDDGAFRPFYGVPLRMATADKNIRGLCPQFRAEGYHPASLTSYMESFISYPPWVQMTPKFNASPENLYYGGAEAGRVYITETGAAASLSIIDVTGHGYQYVVTIPFEIPDIEESYFKSGELSKLELVLEHKAVEADTRVVLDELVKY